MVRGLGRRLGGAVAGRGGGERGAALVEFAILVPLLFMILFGIIEFGFAFRDKLNVDNGVQTSARVAAALGNDPDADLHVLNAVAQGVASLSGAGIDLVERVEVFRVDNAGNPVLGDVNTYYLYSYDGPGGACDWFPCPDMAGGSGVGGNQDPYGGGYGGGAWPPPTRKVAVGDLDVLGVRIYYGHNWFTGGIVPLPDAACDNGVPPPGAPTPSSNCWFEEAVMRLEPLQFSVNP